ncbi:MAG: hypothetical protein AAF600_11935 [Bacteroidota bacterium]
MINAEYENVSTINSGVTIYDCERAIQNTKTSENYLSGSRTLTVYGPFTISKVSVDENWLSVSKAADGKSLTYAFTINTTKDVRNATITVDISGCSISNKLMYCSMEQM